MSNRISAACALLLVAACEPVAPSTIDWEQVANQTDATDADALLAYWFEQNHPKSTQTWEGIRGTDQFRAAILEAHEDVLGAIAREDDAGFNAALLKVVEINRTAARDAAALGGLLSHGAGPRGSSAAIAADSFNQVASMADGSAAAFATATGTICAYIFGEANTLWASEIKYCSAATGSRLYADLLAGKVTRQNFFSYVDPQRAPNSP